MDACGAVDFAIPAVIEEEAGALLAAEEPPMRSRK